MPGPEELEPTLRHALPRLEPPAGFAEQVAARAFRSPLRRRAMAAVLVMAALAGVALLGIRVHQVRQERAQKAAQQLRFALAFTQARIESITNRAIENATRSLNHD